MPGATSRRGSRWWAWVLIAGATVVGIAVPVLGLAVYVSHSLAETSPDQPLMEGEKQRPTASTPLVCPPQCFGLDAADQLAVTTADLSPLPITDEQFGVGEIEPSTVAEAAPEVGEPWVDVGGDPTCSFLIANAPYLPDGEGATATDPIGWVQT